MYCLETRHRMWAYTKATVMFIPRVILSRSIACKCERSAREGDDTRTHGLVINGGWIRIRGTAERVPLPGVDPDDEGISGGRDHPLIREGTATVCWFKAGPPSQTVARLWTDTQDGRPCSPLRSSLAGMPQSMESCSRPLSVRATPFTASLPNSSRL